MSMALLTVYKQIKKKRKSGQWAKTHIEYSNCVIENMRWILWNFIKSEPLVKLPSFSLLIIIGGPVVWFALAHRIGGCYFGHKCINWMCDFRWLPIMSRSGAGCAVFWRWSRKYLHLLLISPHHFLIINSISCRDASLFDTVSLTFGAIHNRIQIIANY